MKAWTVDEVVGFYKSRDAVGIAEVFSRNAVNGADLFSLHSWQHLVDDLRFVPFAAKKALSLRDSFLGE